MPLQKPKERRQFGRRRVYKTATIAQGDNQRLRVTILDISGGGVHIKTPRPELIETEFYLEIPDDDFIVKCRVIWLEETGVGAEFIKAPRRLSRNNK